MGYPNNSERKDLHLRCKRQGGAGWEELPSAGYFLLPMTTLQTSNGTLYSQGVFLDTNGKELSLKAVAGLIDTHGPDAIHHLDGDFVIAVDDSRHGVWCANGPSATLPLFYKLTPDELVITTRAENMTASSADDLDLECIVTVLSSGYPWGDMTLLKNWRAMRPGHMVRIDSNNNAVVAAYFDPENDENIPGYKSPEE